MSATRPSELSFQQLQRVLTSPSQVVRILTEAWVARWAYCPNCGSAIHKLPNNTPVADFDCRTCTEEFELKSQKGSFGTKASDGAYDAMCARLASETNPNLMLLNYDAGRIGVTDFCVVPKQFFVREIIERRRPLGATARRAGWIGCNIRLSGIPAAGKVFLVKSSAPVPKRTVLKNWKSTLFLREKESAARGWLIEVMKRLDRFGSREFGIEDVYAFADDLSRVYPNNRNVRPKLRQQLQFLRDRGYLEFTSRGRYRLRPVF